MTIVTTLEESAWQAFVDQQPTGNIFHTPAMFQVFARAKGHRPRLFAALDDSGQVQALHVPVQVTLLGGPLRPLTTRAIAYGSTLSAADAIGQQALAELLNGYDQQAGRESLFTELRNLTDMRSVQPVLARAGYSYEEHLDYLIDLTGGEEQVMARIGSRTRQHIRRGLRKDVVQVEQVCQPQQLAEWYALVQTTYAAARVPLTDRSLFEAAFDVLHPRGMIIFWLARIDGEAVAASAELLYKDVIYGWYGGVNRAFASDVPGEVLMWQILAWGAAHGYRTYDFGGAGKPGESYGVRDFKAKFGGALVCYGRNTRVHSPARLRVSTWVYQGYRQALARWRARRDPA